jgi:hypothetical protein
MAPRRNQIVECPVIFNPPFALWIFVPSIFASV